MKRSATRRVRLGKGLFLMAVALGTAAVFACGSSSDDPGSSSSSSSSSGASGSSAATGDGKSFYVSKVHGPLSESCKQCHETGKNGAPVFLGASAEASYTAIEGFPGLIALPSVSPILQKGIHSGPALTQTQTDLVTGWLKLEVTTRKLGSDPNTPKNLRAAFKAFGACMDYSRWKALKLHTMAKTTTDGNQGECRSCHNYGQASLWMAGGGDNKESESDNAITFLKFQQFPYVQRLVVGRVTPAGSFEGIESARRIIEKGTEAQQLQANSHPRYSMANELVTNLTTFVLETISNMNQGACTPSVPDAGAYDAASVAPK